MLSIGWIIFWKCVVVTVGVSLMERWDAYKAKRRREGGYDLVFDPDTQSYIAVDKFDRVEKWTKRGLRALEIMAVFYGLIVLYFLIYV